jgi:hypothetical protein
LTCLVDKSLVVIMLISMGNAGISASRTCVTTGGGDCSDLTRHTPCVPDISGIVANWRAEPSWNW